MVLNLKKLRLGFGEKLTQYDLASYLGMTESNYRKLENNMLKSVQLVVIEKLCEFYSCTPNDLISVTNDRQ